MQAKGIDISKWQAGLKIADVKKAGYEFVIMRAGFTSNGDGTTKNKDPQFETFYSEAKQIGMPVGCYWYSGADSYQKGAQEANYIYQQCLKGKQFEYPIYIDVEETKFQSNKEKTTQAILGFCETLQKSGYMAGVYSSRSWFTSNIDVSRIKDITKWVANWSATKPSISLDHFDLWQNSSDGRIGAFTVDTDFAYRDFPAEIKKNGLNGFPKPANPSKQLSAAATNLSKLAKQEAQIGTNLSTFATQATSLAKQLAELAEKIEQIAKSMK